MLTPVTRSLPSVSLEMVTITPELATAWLNNTNRVNRKLRDERVKQYAEIIRNGNWMLNGDTIRFDKNGNLIDGQHRCWAVIEADTPITTLAVYNLEPEVFDTIDDGKKRTGADVLGMSSEKNTSLLAATIRNLQSYYANSFTRNAKMLNADLQRYVRENPEVRVSVDFVSAHKKPGLVTPAVLAAAHYLFATKDLEAANQFVVDLQTGADLNTGDPVYFLRERLIAHKASTTNLPKRSQFAFLLKAWNARRTGRALRNYRMLSTETIPSVI